MTPPEKLPFAPVLRSLLEEEGRTLDHATPEQLVDYRAGRLSADEAALLERHLRGCQECSGLLRDLAEFEEFTPAPAAEALADREAQASWKRVREKLPESKPEPVTAGPRSGPVPLAQPRPVLREPKRRDGAYEVPTFRARRPRYEFLLAAALVGCVVGLGVWVGRLKMQVHKSEEPRAVAAFELHADSVRGSERPALSGQEDPIVFLLDPPDARESGFRAEIHKAGTGEVLMQVGGLHKMQTGTLNLLVSRSLLPPGDYEIVLFAEGGGSTALATYPFKVSSP
jgi:hypothetical protein